MASPEIERKVRQLDNDVQSIYEADHGEKLDAILDLLGGQRPE